MTSIPKTVESVQVGDWLAGYGTVTRIAHFYGLQSLHKPSIVVFNGDEESPEDDECYTAVPACVTLIGATWQKSFALGAMVAIYTRVAA